MLMPGTLMYECCMHVLRVWCLRQGWVGEHDAIEWGPVAGVKSGLKCRGQVLTNPQGWLSHRDQRIQLPRRWYALRSVMRICTAMNVKLF